MIISPYILAHTPFFSIPISSKSKIVWFRNGNYVFISWFLVFLIIISILSLFLCMCVCYFAGGETKAHYRYLFLTNNMSNICTFEFQLNLKSLSLSRKIFETPCPEYKFRRNNSTEEIKLLNQKEFSEKSLLYLCVIYV